MSERTNPKMKRRPTIKDMVTLPFYYNPIVSPDGRRVAYTELMMDLSTNGLLGRFHIYDSETQKNSRVLSDGAEPHWLDNHTLSVLRHSPTGSPRWSDIYIVNDLIGEGRRVVGHSSRISFYTPFVKGFIYLASRPGSSFRIGSFTHVEKEQSKSALYYVSTDRSLQNDDLSRIYFKEEEFSAPPCMFEISSLISPQYHISSIVVSNSTSTVYINCQTGPDLIYEEDTVCFKVELDPEDILDRAEENNIEEALRECSAHMLKIPKGFTIKAVSPDGGTLLVGGPVPGASIQPRPDLWLITDSDASSSTSEDPYTHLLLISEKLDRYPLDVCWTEKGIHVRHWEESSTVVSRVSESGEYETYDFGKISPKSTPSITDNGHIAFAGLSPDALDEVYLGESDDDGGWSLERVTRYTEKYAHLDFGRVESIRWTSKDGTEIEGVLRKPSDFDPSKKYPLVILPHGGPRASSFLSLLAKGDYGRPVHPLIARGILVLEPNYRGGLGRGREFMNLNYDNLGVGDMWDIESGIDHLIAQGFVDETKIGSMGGSQGGYLSAFIGMHTDRCAAVVVNAGVSSWYIYYISSDMRQTVHLPGTPFISEGREAYRKSAPIAGIATAKTPMLIQHGEKDERISVVSAHELHRALKDKGVPTELFTYPNLGHGYLSPRENYSVLLQAYRWLCHYILGDELDLFKDDF